MSDRTRMVVVVAGVVAVLPAACGKVVLDREDANAGATGTGGASASTSGAGPGAAEPKIALLDREDANAGATGTGGASASTSGGDVGGAIGFGGYPDTSGGEAGPGDTPSMPGQFDCGGCICDGATHYCELQYGLKKPPPPGPPPEPLCSDDAGTSSNRCKPIPSACLPEATCQCVYPNLGGCSCTVAPQGITVLCNLP